MPTRPRPRCRYPACPNDATRETYCAEHAGTMGRGTAKERGYGGKRWARNRERTLRRDRFCRCNEPHPVDPAWRCCPQGCWEVATVADHFPKERWQLLEEGIKNPDHPRYLRGLARTCHGRVTMKFAARG